MNTSSDFVPPVVSAPIVAAVPEDKKLLLEWSAPSRPFKKRDKDFFTTISVMAILFIVILFFMKEFLVILVVMALVFLVYVLATVPPEAVTNSIFTTGLQNGLHGYGWQDLQYYWFEDKWGQKMLVARTKNNLPGAVYMLLNGQTPDQIENMIGTRLLKKDAGDNAWMDRAATWLSEKVPLEKSQ
jgi:hypothetical protein